jgi:hypothetical protein
MASPSDAGIIEYAGKEIKSEAVTGQASSFAQALRAGEPSAGLLEHADFRHSRSRDETGGAVNHGTGYALQTP